MSESNVSQLRDVNETPDDSVVAEIEDVLALAKVGKIRSIAIAANMTAYETYTSYETTDLIEAIGLVGFLHHTLCARLRDTSA